MMQRKRYTKEFKLDAVSLVSEQGYSCTEAARSLDVNEKTLSHWVRESRDQGDDAFRGHGNLTSEQEELRQLREENKRLKMEKEILKKATVFFAKETK